MSPTCVVQGRPSVDGGGPVGLDEPLGPRPGLSGPAAEGREVEVAGEPHVRCDEEKRAVSLLTKEVFTFKYASQDARTQSVTITMKKLEPTNILPGLFVVLSTD